MMPAGKYYVGDLCYVMHPEWDEVCDLLFAGRKDGGCNEGEFTLKDGRRFAIFNTLYGDGLYPSNIGRNLSVDSGSIGCILLDDIRDADANEAKMNSLGAIVDFTTDFVTDGDSRNTGTLQFGRVIVETGDLEMEYDPEYDEEEFE